MKLRNFFTISALVAPILVALPACDDDDPKTTNDTMQPDTMQPGDTADTSEPDTAADTAQPDTAADTAQPDTAADTAQPDTAGPTCTHTGFTAAAADAGPFLGAFMYIAQSTLSTPVDTLNIELVTDKGGATTTGSYTLTSDPYESCANCVLIWQGCDENLANCAKTFLAQEGTLDITVFGESGGNFTGTLNDVVLKEVTVDSEFKSTLVEGGETWCLDGYTFDVVVQ